MRRKAVSGLMLILLFVGVLPFVFDVQPVKASETIYIKADGSIDPPTANITSADNVTYTFTDNNYGPLRVERNNIILDGAGYTLQGPWGGPGLFLSHRSNVTIKNMNIIKFTNGIWLGSGSSNNIISGNNITNNHYGISISSSSYTTLRNNSMAGNVYNFDVDSDDLSDYVNDVDVSNTVDGKPIYYWVSRVNEDVPLDAGYVALVNCASITVQNLTLKNNGQGVLLISTTNSTITGNNITDNDNRGISLSYSNNNSISGNHVTNNGWDGIRLSYSNNNSISGNHVTNNGDHGIELFYSSNNSISGNNITENESFGIQLWRSSNSSVSGNYIKANIYGPGIGLVESNSNIISENKIIAQIWIGIGIYSSAGNKFYHNNIINNNDQVDVYYTGYANTWDDGYPSGGNYWSDHTCLDLYSGPNQDQLGKDGIGDTPYVIDANNTDDYPLMKPYPRGQNDIGMTNIVPSKTVVGQEFSVHVNVTIFNYGNNTENFNVTIYANSTVIDTLTNITLTSGHSDIITLTWNTTGFDKGNYNISLYATPLPNETYTEDNAYTYWVIITIMGDVDGDRDVDVGDQRQVQNAMFTTPGEPRWNPNMDIDCDGDIDVGDQRKQQLHMFESW